MADDLAVSFRISVHTRREALILLLREHFDDFYLDKKNKNFKLGHNYATISSNETMEAEEDAECLLPGIINIDFFSILDTVTLEQQVFFVQELLNLFESRGIPAELVSEFNHLI